MASFVSVYKTIFYSAVRRQILLSPMSIQSRNKLINSWLKVDVPIRAQHGDTSALSKMLRMKRVTSDESINTSCLLIERCSERGMPFSSLTVDRMVNAIKDVNDLKSSLYYLHKFRHSDSCYFLRPWTIHMWIRKCMEHDAIDLALQVLVDKHQYGMFPDEEAYCLLVEYCLQKQEYDRAFDFASHMFLTEAMDFKKSHILILSTLHHYKENNTEDNSVLPLFHNVNNKRDFGGMMFRLGQMLQDTSLKLMGLSVLYAVETEHGIRAIYQEPWAPLLWNGGFDTKLLESLRNIKTPVSSESVEIVMESIKDNEQLLKEIELVTSQLQSRDLISKDMNLLSTVKNLKETKSCSDDEKFDEVVQKWLEDDKLLCEIETRILEERAEERERVFEEREIRRGVQRIAVEKLKYWELMDNESEEQDTGDKYYLKENYMQGSLSDIEIENWKMDNGKVAANKLTS